jgi:DNA-binding SARP family transcriptional activator/TolB-like protein/Tfp pilus assembly protein PilF
MTPSACIRLRLLGRPVLTRGGDPAPIRLSTRKAGALVAYLAMSPDQAASREELATLLWGNCSDPQARQSLRQALAFLRKDLGSKDLGSPDFFTADSNMVRLKPGFWSVDALEFESLSKSQDPGDLDKAAALFGGDFLAGLNIEEDGFAEWVRAQRVRTQLAAARLCEIFAGRPELVTDGERAVAAAERLLALDPLREDWQRLALTLYARYRGTSEALAQYEAFSSLLRRELDVAPERDTEALIGRIRNDELALPRKIERALGVPAAASGPPQDRPIAAPAAQWFRLAAAAALAAALAGVVVFGVISYRAAPEPSAPGPGASASLLSDAWRPPAALQSAGTQGIVALAVLPFAALGDTTASTQLVADMMTDDLINVLSRVPGFRVISRRTTQRYKDRPADLAAIGADLAVRYVLEGSLRTQEGLLRVNFQLLDAATLLPVWSDRVEREQGERHAVRDEIVARIARELHINILPIEGERRSADPSADAASFLGWAAMHAGFTTANIDEYRKAEAQFKQALERDPQNMSAFIGMGSFHTNVAVQRLVPDVKAHFDIARDILNQAVGREPRNPNALFSLGLLLQGTGKVREALDLFLKVTELNPSNAGAHAHVGHALARLGEPEKGIEYLRYAMRLSPKDTNLAIWHEFTGNAQLELSRYGDAIESFQRSAAMAPRYPRPYAGLAAAHALAGDTANAQAAIEKLKAVATAIPPGELLQRIARNPKSRLYAGLRLALAPGADGRQSTPLSSRRADGTDARATTAAAAVSATDGEQDSLLRYLATITVPERED